ncbi:MAG: hypothetical protein V2J13_10675 [Cycloclasticus sp.]|jgi:hypothetical protein|nr:hypothetical protein [Cycloclasticus sp.]
MTNVVRTVARSVISSVVSSIIAGGDSIQRLFTTFDSVAQTYIQLSSPVVLSGDFRCDFEYALNNLTNSQAFCGGGASDLFRADPSTGTFQYRINGVFRTTAATFTENTKLNIASIERIGTTVNIYRNGDLIDSVTETVVDFTVSTIGRRAASDYFDGIISNLKITDAGTLVLDMPIDEQYSAGSPTVTNLANPANNGTAVNFVEADSELFTFEDGTGWLGSELWTVGDASSNGTEGTFVTLLTQTPDNTQEGLVYRHVVTVSNLTAGKMSTTLQGNGLNFNENGVFTNIITAGAAGADVIRTGSPQPNNGATVSVSNKRILELA